MRKPWVVGGSIAFAGVVLGLFLVAYGISARRHAADVAAAQAETARVAAFNAAVASSQAERDRNAVAAAASDRAARLKVMAELDPESRADFVRGCATTGCADLPDLLASAKSDAERKKLQRVAAAASVAGAANGN